MTIENWWPFWRQCSSREALARPLRKVLEVTAPPGGDRASEREASERHAPGPHPRGHQGGNRGRYPLPAMSRQRQIFERAADVPWSSGISLLSTLPHAETALVPPEILEPRRRQLGIAHRVLYRAVAEPVLDGPGSCPAFASA